MWGYKAKLDRADTLFSRYIRLRDKKCLYCGREGEMTKDGFPIKGLQNSHYWGRGHESTRFEPDNCMTLCAYHHNYLGHGEGRDEYRDMMIKKLGEKRFKTLELQKNTYKKKDRKLEVIIWKEALKKLIILILLLLPTNLISAEIEDLRPITYRKLKHTESKLKTPQKAILGLITAYNTVESQCDSEPCISASGMNICEYKGFYPLVANNCQPFGKLVEIDGKTYAVEDRLNSRYDCSHWDISFNKDINGAREWGKKFKKIKIL